ncbi:MAG: lamin tail domain-containing protein [Gaiellaceae bacterium]
MQRPISRRLVRGLVAAGLGLALVTAVSAAPSGSEAEGQISACRHKTSGHLRVPASGSTCKRAEQALTWNVSGPSGPQGERGPQGPAGPAGERGAAGATGATGPAGVTGPAGAAGAIGSAGPVGSTGAQGVAGPVGPAGPPGPAGAAGASLTSIGQLNGVACTTAAGGSGTVSVATAAGGAISLACTATTTPPPPPPPPPAGRTIVINEIDYDQVGADGGGFVELRNNGAAAADLSGLAVVLVDGSDGLEYDREALTGELAAGGYLAVAIEPQNGAPDGVALVDTATGAVLDALSYEGEIVAAQIGTATVSLVEGTALAASVADSNAVAGSLIRNPDGRDTNNAASDWAFTTTTTRGAANVASG